MRRGWLIAAIAAGCATAEPPAPVGEPRLSWLHANVFSPSCTASTCHGKGASPAGNLSLADPAATHAQLVNQVSGQLDDTGKPLLRVAPGQPLASVIYLAVIGNYGTLKRMPIGMPLEAHKIEALRSWIAAGAKAD